MRELTAFITLIACRLLNYFLMLKEFVSKTRLAFSDAL